MTEQAIYNEAMQCTETVDVIPEGAVFVNIYYDRESGYYRRYYRYEGRMIRSDGQKDEEMRAAEEKRRYAEGIRKTGKSPKPPVKKRKYTYRSRPERRQWWND